MTRASHDDEIAALDEIITHLDRIRESAARRVRRGLEDPWPVFARTMRLLSSQAWGSRVESWLRAHHGWGKVDPSLARGDARSGDAYLELKTSFITPTNRQANFVQIRPHHAVDGYELFVVESDYTLVHFRLTASQMARELERAGGLAHGTIAQGAGRDAHAEYALRVRWDPRDPLRARFARYEVARGAPGEACCGA